MNDKQHKGAEMKRRKFIFLVLVVFGVLAFGANAALASIDFNPQTGEMSYVTEGVKTVNGDDVLVRHAESYGFTTWTKIEYKNWQFGQPQATPSMTKYCFHEDYVLWACPAAKVKIVAGRGGDTITVNSNVTIPTTLIGGPGSDSITGGGGNDTIRGGCASPADFPCAGYTDTNDVLHGGNGDDVFDGGPGADQFYGGLGKDFADYSSRSQSITATLNDLGDDGEANEHDYIANDNEGIIGGSYNDILVGNNSTNTLAGGPGSDILRGKLGADVLQGGLGTDLVTYDERSNPVIASINNVANSGEAGEGDTIQQDVENLTGGSGNDTLTGDYRANLLIGGGGNDKLYGAPMNSVGLPLGPDKLYGQDADDLLYGGWYGSPGDYLDGGVGTDMVTYADRAQGVAINLSDPNLGEDHIYGVENATGSAGDDTMIGNDGKNTFFAGGGYDVLNGNGGSDVLGGQDGNDQINGGAGHDVVSGGKDDDWLVGGPDDDYISGHEGVDTVTYSDYTVPVSVSLDGAYNDGAVGEGDNVLVDVERVIGGSKNDTLVGSSVANSLYGGGGNDSLSGLGGNDTLDGQSDTDSADGGADTDSCQSETVVNCEGAVQSATLGASPSSVAAGGNVSVTFGNVSGPTSTDWIGLYHPGDANDPAIAWKYANSCTQAAGNSGMGSGSCSFTMPATAGTYEFRLLTNGYTVIAKSGTVTVSGAQNATLTVNTSSAAKGGTVTVTFTNPNPTSTDWIGLYKPGDANDPAIAWKYANSCTQAAGNSGMGSGSCSFTMPATAGTYEFRLLTNGYTVIAKSGTVTVS
jgi:Ca2+-binding RTX toxin-like protein